MEIAKIHTEKVASLPNTLRNMPIGREQVILSRVFSTGSIRKTASKLKAEGYEFVVSNRGMVDTCVTRLK